MFGEVPDSVKESLAAKEALREATANGFEQRLRKMEESVVDAGGTTTVSERYVYLRISLAPANYGRGLCLWV